MSARKHVPYPTELEVSDDDHPVFIGSYVRLSKAPGGCVDLEVGDNCVVTVRGRVPVAVLAAALTHVHDLGFRKALDGRWDDDVINRLLPS